MRSRGFWAGLAGFLLLLMLPPPAAMPLAAWHIAALTFLMACWWMTEALPLTATALLPFLAVPLMGVMPANDIAAAYYSPILFLVLGGAFIALAIERVGLHRRLALAILARSGHSGESLLLAFMCATALLSFIVSNTATTLIMMPIAIVAIRAAGIEAEEKAPFAIALVLGIAYAASIGGMGTLVGSPTNAIAAGMIERTLGFRIDFLTWATFGLPLVAVAIPVTWFLLVHSSRLEGLPVSPAAIRAAIGAPGPWTPPEKRLAPLVALVVAGWVLLPLIEGRLPKGAVTDGSIAILGGLLLFLIPAGDGRPLLTWKEANRAPWDVIMMFGGGLALAEAITASGLAGWMGTELAVLNSVSPIIIALVLTAIVVLVTEFASNVATASGVMPVVASLIAGTGADPVLLAMPAAIAASWGFMLPSGTGPNAIAYASGHIRVGDMLRAGFLLDLVGIPLVVAVVFLVSALG